ncbi:MAG TPA: hypothetical protein DGK91_00925 [Clostridium sp.]|nr:hypothetical protein [Clostridia bacterium]HCW03209.1 hypothetical protein [Clostridium sp.]
MVLEFLSLIPQLFSFIYNIIKKFLVLEEWLYKRDFRYKNTVKYKTLFERNGKQIECSIQLKDAKSLAAITEENTLFLSICSNAKIPYVKDVRPQTCLIITEGTETEVNYFQILTF